MLCSAARGSSEHRSNASRRRNTELVSSTVGVSTTKTTWIGLRESLAAFRTAGDGRPRLHTRKPLVAVAWDRRRVTAVSFLCAGFLTIWSSTRANDQRTYSRLITTWIFLRSFVRSTKSMSNTSFSHKVFPRGRVFFLLDSSPFFLTEVLNMRSAKDVAEQSRLAERIDSAAGNNSEQESAFQLFVYFMLAVAIAAALPYLITLIPEVW